MNFSKLSFIPFLLILCMSMTCSDKVAFLSDNFLAVAFYNLDNLFDDIDDSDHNDQQFTPNGTYKWTQDRYKQKINNMNKVIAQLVNGAPPDVLGVCELESETALKDLIQSGPLNTHYKYVHFDSPDERGIDVAFIYNQSKLNVIHSQAFSVAFSQDSNDKTRDVLWVQTVSKLSSDTLNFIVLHFPSRKAGKMKSEHQRIDAAKTCLNIIQNHIQNQYLVVMGDFNDQPNDVSVNQIIGAKKYKDEPNANLFNLMQDADANEIGSYFYRGHWEKLDQIIISNNLRNTTFPNYIDSSINRMKKDWMMQKGKYEGYPLRTFGGNQWLNGYSDHLPVFMTLQLK